MKKLDRFFALAFVVGALIAGLGLAYFAPLFVLILPVMTIPVFAYGYARYLDEIQESRKKVAFKDAEMLMLGTSVAKKMRIESDEPNFVDIASRRPAPVVGSTVDTQQQIDEINTYDLQRLVETLPADGTVKQEFNLLNGTQWIYQFHCKARMAEFNAVGAGATPRLAFEMAKKIVQLQVREWHDARAKNRPYVGHTNEISDNEATEVPAIFSMTGTDYAGRKPTVLIIEDDTDTAIATADVFKKLGCETLISDGRDGAPQKMSFDNVDFIVLDWMLGENLSGDQLISRSERIINAFRDLQDRFKIKSAKVITFSSLNRAEIHLPESRYFAHLDHWQKPVQFKDLAHRAEELLEANGF